MVQYHLVIVLSGHFYYLIFKLQQKKLFKKCYITLLLH